MYYTVYNNMQYMMHGPSSTSTIRYNFFFITNKKYSKVYIK